MSGNSDSMGANDVTVIRAGRLVDVESGEVLSGRTIVVRGDRIKSVAESKAVAAEGLPPDARVIDLSSSTVIPGMIDCHTHLIGPEEGPSLASVLENTQARDVLLGVDNARKTLHAGFTTVRDVGTFRAFTDLELRRAIDEGIVQGPRMMCAGAYITVTGGGGEVTGGLAEDVAVPPSMRFGVADNAAQVRERARAILNNGADFIKIIATGAVLAPGTKPGVAEYTEKEIRAAVEIAAQYATHVAAHAHGPDGIKAAVLAGVRSIEHGSLIDDECIELMVERGTYLDADIYCGDWIEEEGGRAGWAEEVLQKNEETTEAQRKGFRKAVEAGVKISFGTDSGVYPHGWNAKQIPYLVKHGLSPINALRAATLWSSQLMGWHDRVGSISPEKFADIVAVDEDPTENILTVINTSFVMKGGAVVKGPGAAPA